MGLARVIEDLNTHQDQPWTPEARKMRKEIVTAANSAAGKLEKFAGVKCNLPPYNTGDEAEFFYQRILSKTPATGTSKTINFTPKPTI